MSEDFTTVDCCTCGIQFKFSKKIEEMWRKSEKHFFCPNGHDLHWPAGKETPEQKENKTLKEEVKALKAKLETALKDVDSQKFLVAELLAELEIWRPSSADEPKKEAD